MELKLGAEEPEEREKGEGEMADLVAPERRGTQTDERERESTTDNVNCAVRRTTREVNAETDKVWRKHQWKAEAQRQPK